MNTINSHDISSVARSLLFALATLVWTVTSYAQAASETAISLTSEELNWLLNFNNLKTSETTTFSDKKTKKALAVAFEASPAIRSSSYTIQSANSDKVAAEGAKKPQITGVVQSAYTQSDLTNSTQTTGKPSLTLTGQIVVYDWGRLDAIINNRSALVEAADARLRATKNDLAIEVISTCLEINKQIALLGAAKYYTATIEDLTNRISKVTEADPGRASEMVQTQSRVLQARSSEKVTESKIRELTIRLAKHLPGDTVGLCAGIGASYLSPLDDVTIDSRLASHAQLVLLNAQYQSELLSAKQIELTKRPQISLVAQHAPVSAGITNDYAQSISLQATAVLYDGNTLNASQLAAAQRASSVLEQRERLLKQLQADFKERSKLAATLETRTIEYISLLEINQRVRDDFFIQWAALGRRTLFELLAIEAEQYSLRTGYIQSLYDSMLSNASVLGNLDFLHD